MMPKVSILIPVFNCEQYLRKTIESALSQNWKNIELVIVDDGSTDQSLSIAREYEKENVKVFTTPNRGACHARNLAFYHSTGDFIQYLDADDLMSVEKIQEQITLIQSHEKTIASCKWVHFFNENEYSKNIPQETYKSYNNPVDLLVDLWKHREMLQTSVWLVPRILIIEAGPWDTSLRINQDGEFFSRVILKSEGIKFSNKAQVYYRSGLLNSISRRPKNWETVNSLLHSYLSMESEILKSESSERIYNALSYNYSSFIYHYNNLFPDLADTAKKKLKDWNIKPIHSVGGPSFIRMSTIFGFNNALKLRKLLAGK